MNRVTRDPERRAAMRALDELARKDPDKFRSAYRALVLRAFGYVTACVVVPLLLLAAGAIGMVRIPGHLPIDLALLAVGAIGTVGILRCVIFKLHDRPGLQLDRRTHVLLFKDLNEIRKSIAAPKFDRIEFEMDCNASVRQRPRWLGFLGSHNVLTIGFPLIFALRRDELRAILAHEMAHISRRHGLGRILLMRLFISIDQLYTHLERRSGLLARVLIRPFLDRLMPALLNHHSVMSRLHELEADRIAAKVCGVELCANTLVKLAVLGTIEEEFQESIDEEVRRSDIPTFSRLEHFLKLVDRARREPARCRERVEIELERRTDLDDSHPALNDRLAAIGGTFSGTIDLQNGAAEEYFDRDRENVLQGFDRQWLSAVLDQWRESHLSFRQLRNKLTAKSDLLASGKKLHSFEYGQIARWTDEAYGKREGLAAYADYHARFPHLSEGRFHYGRLLLAAGDEKGISLLEELLRTEPMYREASLRAMAEYFLRRRRRADLHRCLDQLEKSYGESDAAIKDRLKFTRESVFSAHGLDRVMSESLYKLCAEFPEVRTLHLMKKEVKTFPESPFFVAAVDFDRRKCRPPEREQILLILRSIIDLPGAWIVTDARQSRRVRVGIKRCGDATTKIYDRADG